MAEFDTTELLSDIRERGSIPSADLRFTDAKLLSAASLELRDVIAALLVESQTERGVYLEDTTATVGTSDYRLPRRALAARYKSVGWKSPGDSNFTRLRHLNPDAYYLQDSSEGTPSGFYLRDDSLVLVPTPNVAGTLRVPYYARPNTLIASTAARTVASYAGAAVTLSSAPPGTFTSGAEYDIVRATPGFSTLVSRVTATVAGSVLTFASTIPTSVAAGDYVCLAGQAPVAQCPVELRGLLAVRAARRALKSVGEGEEAAMLEADVAELTETARDLLAPRVDSEPQEWGDARRGLLMGVL